MNIFYLDNDPQKCAEMHVDKHCVKMILEYAQLLSTAHRVIDGKETIEKSKTNRNVRRWNLPDDRDSILYSATHINHPSAIWVRYSRENYEWLFSLFIELMREYHYRYGKIHACMRLAKYLKTPPSNLLPNTFTEPTPAMPDDYKVAGNSVQSYHNYYNNDKQRMFSWKNRSTPYFIAK